MNQSSAISYSTTLAFDSLLREWQELLDLAQFAPSYSGFVTVREFLKVIAEMGKIVDSNK